MSARPRAIGALVLLAGCTPAPAPAPAPRTQSLPATVASALASAAPSAVPLETPARAGAEASLGVVDRGVYSDLDARLQLPPPEEEKKLSALVDARHRLLVVYADDFPYKVYPLGGSAKLVLGALTLELRPGDRAELEPRLDAANVRALRDREIAPPGDADDDGIPDPLDVLLGAHKAVLGGASYDDGYFSLKYPNGDPPRDKGACVDVIVRAVRNAGVDLQSAVVEDERGASAAYGSSHVDPNIDHRRVKNAIVYFKRHWEKHSAAVDDPADPLHPGDVVFLDTFASRPGPDHVGIVAEKKGKSGHPLVINLWTFGYQTQAMDLLGAVPVTDRFRFPSRR